MIEFIWDTSFKKAYKKRISPSKKLQEKFKEAITIFSKNPFDTRLKTHKLSGILKENWAFSVEYDCRVVFKFLSENKVLLVDIGSHEEVY